MFTLHKDILLHLVSYAIGYIIRMSPGTVASHMNLSLMDSEVWFGCFCACYCISHLFWGFMVDKFRYAVVCRLCYAFLISTLVTCFFVPKTFTFICILYGCFGFGFSGLFPCLVDMMQYRSKSVKHLYFYLSVAQLCSGIGAMLSQIYLNYVSVLLYSSALILAGIHSLFLRKKPIITHHQNTSPRVRTLLNGTLAALLVTGSSVYAVFSHFILVDSYGLAVAQVAGALTTLGGLCGMVFLVPADINRKKSYLYICVLSFLALIASLLIKSCHVPALLIYPLVILIGFTPTARYLLFEVQKSSCFNVCLLNLFITLGGAVHVLIGLTNTCPQTPLYAATGQFFVAFLLAFMLWKKS